MTQHTSPLEESVAYELLKSRDKLASSKVRSPLGDYCSRNASSNAERCAINRIAASAIELNGSSDEASKYRALCYYALSRYIDTDKRRVAAVIREYISPSCKEKKSEEKWIYKQLRAGELIDLFHPVIWKYKLSIDKLDVLYGFPKLVRRKVIERGAIVLGDFPGQIVWSPPAVYLKEISLSKLRIAKNLLIGNETVRKSLTEKLSEESVRLARLSVELRQAGMWPNLAKEMEALVGTIDKAVNDSLH